MKAVCWGSLQGAWAPPPSDLYHLSHGQFPKSCDNSHLHPLPPLLSYHLFMDFFWVFPMYWDPSQFLKMQWVLVAQLCPTLWTPRTVACQAPLFIGFSRQEHWCESPCPPPRDLSNPRIKLVSLMSPALAGGFFTTNATWEACAWYDEPIMQPLTKHIQ